MIGLTKRQRVAVDFILANPRAGLADIAEAIGLSRKSKGYVSHHLLPGLERRGWIKCYRRRAVHQSRLRRIQIVAPIAYEARGERFQFIPIHHSTGMGREG